MNRTWKQMTANMLVLMTLASPAAFAGGHSGGGRAGGSAQGHGNVGMISKPSFSVQGNSGGTSNSLANNGNSFKGVARSTQSFNGQFKQVSKLPLASTTPRQNQHGLGNIGLNSQNAGKLHNLNVGNLNHVTQIQKGHLNFGNLTSNQALNSNSIKHLKPIGLNGSLSNQGLANGFGKKIDPIFSQGPKGMGKSFYCGNGIYGNNFCGNGWFGNGFCGNSCWGNYCGNCCGNYCGGWWGCGNYCCGNWFGNCCGGYYPLVQPYPLTTCSPIYVSQPNTVVEIVPVTTTTVVKEVAPALPPSPAPLSAREIDLAVKEVKIVSKGDAQNGPLYRVTIMNKGPLSLDKPARVALISINDGKPSTDTPRMIETVKSLKVGETAEMDMRLPVAANTFPMLLVAVETPDSYKDTNEQDNVAQGEVAQLSLAVAAVQ